MSITDGEEVAFVLGTRHLARSLKEGNFPQWATFPEIEIHSCSSGRAMLSELVEWARLEMTHKKLPLPATHSLTHSLGLSFLQ